MINPEKTDGMNKQSVDSIIFDMDGTLWDAVDSYCLIWDTTFAEMGYKADPVTRQQLLGLMGSYLQDIIKALAPDITDLPAFLKRLEHNEHTMMTRLGGRLYPGVKETIAGLSRDYRLFMVSNCGEFGLDNFLVYTGLKPYFTDTRTHGGTRRPKSENIRDLIDRYNLIRPVYVGDTQGDADQAHSAGIPIIYAAYGFGQIADPDYIIDSITELPAVAGGIGSDKCTNTNTFGRNG